MSNEVCLFNDVHACHWCGVSEVEIGANETGVSVISESCSNCGSEGVYYFDEDESVHPSNRIPYVGWEPPMKGALT